MLLKYPKDAKRQIIEKKRKNTFKSNNSNVVMSKNIMIFCDKDELVYMKYMKNLRNGDDRKLGKEETKTIQKSG